MLNEVYQAPLEGLEGMHQDLRQCVCECGCGTVFYQKRIGRVRKYLDKTHKAKAHKVSKTKPLIGDTVKEILLYIDGTYAKNVTELLWLEPRTAAVLAALYESKIDRDALAHALNTLFSEYCK